MTTAKEALELLGCPMRDRVTGFRGVCGSVSFDLYGCVQVLLTPAAEPGGTDVKESRWYDFNRLEVTSAVRVMDPPDFLSGTSDKGPSEKPVGRW